MNGIEIITENKTKVLIGNKTADEVLKEICEICHHNLIYLSSFRDKLDKIEDFDYEEACKNWWKNMTEENKEIIKSIPNFDAEVFEKITGIKV